MNHRLQTSPDDKTSKKIEQYYLAIQHEVNVGNIEIPKVDITSKFDNNPLFKLLYKYLPGGQAFTDVHDSTINVTKGNDIRKDNDVQKMGTIPISFVTTFISLTAGKPFTSEKNKD